MLPPKPRLLTMLEILDENQATKSGKANQRYPHRRGLERAARSFLIYLLVASRFADGTEAKPEKKTGKPPGPPGAKSP